MKCWFCDVTFECQMLFGGQMSQDAVDKLHARKNGKCTFLIEKLGVVKMQEMRMRREIPRRIRERATQERAEPESVENMPTYELLDEDELHVAIASQVGLPFFQIIYISIFNKISISDQNFLQDFDTNRKCRFFHPNLVMILGKNAYFGIAFFQNIYSILLKDF